MAQAKAMIFRYGGEAPVALPPHVAMAVMDSAGLVEVPGAPSHCRYLLRWQERLVPVIDLQGLLTAAAGASATAYAHVLVVAYQAGARQPLDYGALMLASLPATVTVDDATACALPDDSASWRQIALSCFELDGQRVPVLDTARLFAAPAVPA